jgi:hypothetical protein
MGDLGYIDADTKKRLRERWQVAVVTRLKENMKLELLPNRLRRAGFGCLALAGRLWKITVLV